MQGGVELCLHSRGFPGNTLHDRPLGACDLSTPSLVFREAWVWVRWTVSLAAAVGQGRPASPQRKTGKGPKSAEAGVSRDSPAPTAGQFFLLGGSATHPLQSASSFSLLFYLNTISDLQKACKDSTKNSHTPFTWIPQM